MQPQQIETAVERLMPVAALVMIAVSGWLAENWTELVALGTVGSFFLTAAGLYWGLKAQAEMIRIQAEARDERLAVKVDSLAMGLTELRQDFRDHREVIHRRVDEMGRK